MRQAARVLGWMLAAACGVLGAFAVVWTCLSVFIPGAPAPPVSDLPSPLTAAAWVVLLVPCMGALVVESASRISAVLRDG
ncbi:MAG TPA: hypothetical protein VF151_10610 [Gemmatimonadales bacterium]